MANVQTVPYGRLRYNTPPYNEVFGQPAIDAITQLPNSTITLEAT